MAWGSAGASPSHSFRHRFREPLDPQPAAPANLFQGRITHHRRNPASEWTADALDAVSEAVRKVDLASPGGAAVNSRGGNLGTFLHMAFLGAPGTTAFEAPRPNDRRPIIGPVHGRRPGPQIWEPRNFMKSRGGQAGGRLAEGVRSNVRVE